MGTVLSGRPWPAHFACTAVDAATGEFQLWNGMSPAPARPGGGVELRGAGDVPPITIGDKRYMDGGVRTMHNADLAEGHEAVLVVSVMMTAAPGIGTRLSASSPARTPASEHLRPPGSKVEVIEARRRVPHPVGHGHGLMDFTMVKAAADAGVRLGQQSAERLAAIW